MHDQPISVPPADEVLTAAAGHLEGVFTADGIWTDAYRIAWVGGSNPVGIAVALARDSTTILNLTHSTDTVRAHPALRAIAGHLAFLYGQGSGPAEADLATVADHARRLGLLKDAAPLFDPADCRAQGHEPSDHINPKEVAS